MSNETKRQLIEAGVLSALLFADHLITRKMIENEYEKKLEKQIEENKIKWFNVGWKEANKWRDKENDIHYDIEKGRKAFKEELNKWKNFKDSVDETLKREKED